MVCFISQIGVNIDTFAVKFAVQQQVVTASG